MNVVVALLAAALVRQVAVAGEPDRPVAQRPSRATTEPPGPSPETAGQPVRVPARLDLSRHVIRQAIADTGETDAGSRDVRPTTFGGGPASSQERVDRKFKDADIPTCMTMDAWKFDPPRIGPIPIPGFFAAPWLIRNIVTGRCRH